MNYAKLYTLRKDGRYQGFWFDDNGKRHALCDRDPHKLFEKIKAREEHKDKEFKEVADEWLRDHNDIGWKTYDSYKAPLKQINEHFGIMLMEDITSAEISAFINSLKRKGYARRTVQMRRDLMNMIFNYAIMEGYVKVNPVAAVSMPKNMPVTKREPPPPEAIQAIKDHKDDDEFSLIPYTLLMTGMRRQELLGLKQEDIDREHKVIHIRRAVEYIGNNASIKNTKTQSSVRTIPLLDALDLPTKDGYVFSNDEGKIMTKTVWLKRWQAYCKRIGYEFTAHQLRHAYASRLFELEIAPKDAQELLGHSNITTTMNIYTHISKNHKQEVTDKLNKFF